eukprot:TRINITY_DN63452_c0_g1_i1.p1 TRINITY_DN63452_c0_g1~~TRINITY_DN63452_c0_g1_i1.p1  ORF type:complete len:884 (-),score=123.55 TRINITY_DN63452_c0_g1_i1:135-2786(-)
MVGDEADPRDPQRPPAGHVSLDVAHPTPVQEDAHTAHARSLPGQSSVARGREVPPLRLDVHGVEGVLSTSTVSPLVRVHLVDASSGNHLPKATGQHCVFNLDKDGVPYLRNAKSHPMVKDHRQSVPWAADSGQATYVPPFSTLPCRLRRSRGGAQQELLRWDEAFLMSEPIPEGSALLFEVLDATTETDSDNVPQVVLSPLGWGFIYVDSALRLVKNKTRRLRLQLHKYRRRSRWNFGRQRDTSDDMEQEGTPLVVQDYLAAGLGEEPEDTPSFLTSVLTALTGRGRRERWPAALEITLNVSQKTTGLEKVAKALTSQVHDTSVLSQPVSEGAALETSALSAIDMNQSMQESKVSKEPDEENLGHLAPHNVRQKDHVCALPESLLWQITAGSRGASRLALSPSNMLLATACARSGGSSELRIFHLGSGRTYATCASAHDALVYDLCWHSFSGGTLGTTANPLLISCGGDGVVLVYEVPEDFVPVPGLPPPCLQVQARLTLPSHVYSVAVHPALSADPRRIILVCGGHSFGIMICEVSRVWTQSESSQRSAWAASTPHYQQQVSYEASNPRRIAGEMPTAEQTSGPPDVLCVRFSTQANSLDSLYATDAAGHIMLFQIRADVATGGLTAGLVRSYAGMDLAGKAIYGLEVVTQQLVKGGRLSPVQLAMVDDWVLVFSRDHIVRLASLQRGVLKIELQMLGIEGSRYPVMGTMSPDGSYVACGSETGELCVWNAMDGKQVPAGSVPQVRLAGPMMHVVWSEKHHLVACCALDDQAPPLLVFTGGDPNVSSLQVLTGGELPHRPPPLKDAPKEEPLLVTTGGILTSIAAEHKWASQWINADENPRSAIAIDEKRRMKENILLSILDKKSSQEAESHFASRGLPGGL